MSEVTLVSTVYTISLVTLVFSDMLFSSAVPKLRPLCCRTVASKMLNRHTKATKLKF